MNILERFAARDATQVRGVALVVHGLNLEPRQMGSVIDCLTGANIDVFNLVLRGHGDNYVRQPNCPERTARLSTCARVEYTMWADEVYMAYKVAESYSQHRQLPLFLVGFSLGGLLVCDLLVSQNDIHAERMLLLAPALKVRRTSHLIKLLLPIPGMRVPSLAPSRYQANWALPAAAYRATFAALDHFAQRLAQPTSRGRLNIPTLVLMSKRDELVSYRGIQTLIEQYQFDQWVLNPIQKSRDARVLLHHPVFDPSAVGAIAWQQMMNCAAHHLLADEPVHALRHISATHTSSHT